MSNWSVWSALNFCTFFVLILVVNNMMVICAVITNKAMRTGRNIFIFNLAFSDLLLGLCLPFIIQDKLSKQFPFPQHEIFCK